MPRIQIGHDAARALKVTAAMRDMRPHELMEELIMRHCGHLATTPNDQVAKAPSGHVAMEPDEHVTTTPSSHMVTEPELPPDSEKTASRQSSPLEENRPKGTRPWHGGPPPYEEQHPEIAARVMEMWAGGAKKGGMGRRAVTKALQAEGVAITEAIVSQITIRARKKQM